MASAEVESGICGFSARIEATADGQVVRLHIVSDCPRLQKLAEGLTEADPLTAVGPRSRPNPVMDAAAEAKLHMACVVPSAIVKALEVEAGLALPRDAHIRVSKE